MRQLKNFKSRAWGRNIATVLSRLRRREKCDGGGEVLRRHYVGLSCAQLRHRTRFAYVQRNRRSVRICFAASLVLCAISRANAIASGDPAGQTAGALHDHHEARRAQGRQLQTVLGDGCAGFRRPSILPLEISTARMISNWKSISPRVANKLSIFTSASRIRQTAVKEFSAGGSRSRGSDTILYRLSTVAGFGAS